ncbi:hypothetical protein NA56DRAFT_266840 [Hyaloscypha hepaticicola]|uniref:Uncharacterized protein n=1 Tax=Hyaloscypha hepaticicola TaxID=2082293 RepID=A0A2J6PTT4_9HELO|nr:hypothetical protein NA56DRAFT_266840 [Hyaloscypha hepaticicola]
MYAADHRMRSMFIRDADCKSCGTWNCGKFSVACTRCTPDTAGITGRPALFHEQHSESELQILFFKARHEVEISMKSEVQASPWMQSKIPPMRTPKDTQQFSTPRCAMEVSYCHQKPFLSGSMSTR